FGPNPGRCRGLPCSAPSVREIEATSLFSQNQIHHPAAADVLARLAAVVQDVGVVAAGSSVARPSNWFLSKLLNADCCSASLKHRFGITYIRLREINMMKSCFVSHA